MESNAIIDRNFANTDDDYAQILRFVGEHNRISYSQFDSSILSRVNLFALPEHFDFEGLGEALDVIIKTLPAIKRIFAKPITHIKTSSEILPVESVRVINNETVVHASVHSELWENVTRSGLKPRKLLTQDNQDNYAIYENVIFTRAVDMILLFVGKNIRFLNDILYANRDLKFNLLERENHLSYFLAIGKLHTGYVRDYAKYSVVAENCMDKLLFIDRVIRSRTSSPVYKHCKRYSGNLTLKKTNVFRMHKDYHRIYVLLKWFADFKIVDTLAESNADKAVGDGYRLFCSLLTLFAAGHFNFTFSDKPIDFDNLDVECTFDKWRLKLETVKCGETSAIRFTFLKDIPYRVIMLPAEDTVSGKSELEAFESQFEAEEYLLAVSQEDENDTTVLSLFDIDSFRRIQQILFRGMVYSDKTRDVCPFCGQPLSQNEDIYECASCRTQLLSLTCRETGEPYFATKIKNYVPPKDNSVESLRREKLSNAKHTAAQMRFRNITKIGAGTEIICPKCGHIHS